MDDKMEGRYSVPMKHRGITLIGMSGVGKSTVGRALAGALSIPCIDTDMLIERHVGKSLQAFLDEVGEEEFLKVEREVVLSIDMTTPRVFAPGGSIVYLPDAMEYLNAHTTTIYLEASASYIEGSTSIAGRGIVGLRGRTFSALLKERAALYTMYADNVVSAEEKTESELVGAIISLVSKRNQGH